MKKNYLFMAFLGAFLMTSFVLPVIANGPIIPEWISLGKLPLIDPVDDVYEYITPGNPWNGTPTNAHKELDFAAISVNGSSLNIQFYGVPQPLTLNKGYIIFISNDSDDSTWEYEIDIDESIFYFVSLADGFWTGGSWTGAATNCSYSIVSNSIMIPNITTAIPNIANYRVGGLSYDSSGPPYYADRIGASGGIPSFSGAFLFFSLITILGLLSLLRKRELPF